MPATGSAAVYVGRRAALVKPRAPPPDNAISVAAPALAGGKSRRRRQPAQFFREANRQMARFNIYHVKINEFYRLYDDLIRSIAQSLIDLGHSCTVRHNELVPEAINILVGSTIFASRYHGLAAALNGRPYIVYQLECLDDQRGLLSQWPEYWAVLENAGAIWDYSPSSTAYLLAKAVPNVHHVPPAFHRSLESFRPRPEPDIDILFFGSPHPRRQRVIEALRGLGFHVVDLHGVFGDTRNRYLARAKIVLNIHAWDGLTPLETVRLSLLLANRVFVISEEADHNPYEDGVVYGPYERSPSAAISRCASSISSKPCRRRSAAWARLRSPGWRPAKDGAATAIMRSRARMCSASCRRRRAASSISAAPAGCSAPASRRASPVT
jgi:hypothetical protein